MIGCRSLPRNKSQPTEKQDVTNACWLTPHPAALLWGTAQQTLAFAGRMNIRNPSWCKVGFEWLALIFAIGVVFAELASGYSWTLPVVGVVPGPPSPGMMRAFGIALVVCLTGVIVAGTPVLVFGTPRKRIAGGIPVIVVFLIGAALVYSHLN